MSKLNVNKIIALALIVVLLLVASALSMEFWASRKSDRYHFPDCRHAERIKPANLIKFASSGEARKAGYTPCKACRPPDVSGDKAHQ